MQQLASFRQKARLIRTLKSLPFLAAALGVFLRPAAAMAGVARGLDACVHTIIPSMFPFLVLSQLVLESPLAEWAGLALLPYTRLLGIRSKKAPSALLCGLLGGFAAGARSIGLLHRSGELSGQEASRLMVCTICSGPSFVVGSVGTVMLGSTAAGWALFGGQVLASLVCGLLFLGKDAPPPALLAAPAGAPDKGFVNAVADGVHATALLCGYITLFAFFAAVATPANAGAAARLCVTLPLEVTSACLAAAELTLPGKIYLCAAAVSVMGASVFVQVRAFAGPGISLTPLLLSRLAHLPLMLALLRIFLAVFPLSLPASAPLGGWTPAFRMPADAFCAVFVLCALIFAPQNGWQRHKKGL